MSDSEDDYMSDQLLVKCQENDIRPGLVFKKTEKRKLDNYKKQIELRNKKPKTIKEQEQEAREKGLNTAISSENKGFKLLQKMGFKPGTSLGKSSTGIKEPINVIVKDNLSGVGRSEHIKKISSKKTEVKEKMMHKIEEAFKSTTAEKIANKFLLKDMYKAQRICEELDFRKEIKFPVNELFWTADTIKKLKRKEKEDEEDSEEETEPPPPITLENLQNVIEYLRNIHFYCMYCAVTYEGEEDLNTNCPGPFREDHDD